MVKRNRIQSIGEGKASGWIIVLWICAIAVNIKSVFMDYGVDNAYALATSYRHILGDRLFCEMWEPHQTSAFLVDLLLYPYGKWIPSYEGAALYLQICGTALYGILTYILFKKLSYIMEKLPAHLMCIFFFSSRAKQTVFPEFSNMHIAFSVGMAIALCCCLYKKNHTFYLITAAVFLCLECLAYPSCVITVFPVMLWLFFVSERRAKDVIVFVAVCVLLGGVYLGYFSMRLGGGYEFANRLKYIFTADSTHNGSLKSVNSYFYNTFQGLLWILAAAIISWVIYEVCKKVRNSKRNFLSVFGFILFLTEGILLIGMSKKGVDWKYTYSITYLVSVVIGLYKFKYLNSMEKRICALGYLISASSVLSVCLLTNLDFITTMPYMVLGVMASFFSIWRSFMQEEAYNIQMNGKKKTASISFLVYLCLLVIFHRGLCVMGYSSEKGSGLLFDAENIIRCGPSKGIVASVEICNKAKADREQWSQYMDERDSCLAVGGWIMDSTVYMNSRAQIANYSMINTTTYNTILLKYWEMYPQKTPTVIAVAGYEGQSVLPDASFLQEWIDKNYRFAGNGTFWIFYRIKN